MSGPAQGEVHAPSAAPGAESNPYARLPDYRPDCTGLPPDPELLREREEIRWEPGMTLDGDLLMYLRAARSMAAFAGMCDGGSPEDGCIAASRDDTTINALDVLHDSGYDQNKALQALVKCPAPRGVDKKWCEDETKRFVKGLRQFGKNFFRIRKDLLPHKETPELVEYYYLWKKTPGANNNRPHRRRRAGSLRRIRTTRSTRSGTPKEEQVDENAGVVAASSTRPSPSLKESGDDNSGSDEDNSEDDSDSRDRENPDQCQHCLQRTTDLAPASTKERPLLCADCRAHLKKCGELPPMSSKGGDSRSDAPYLFRPVQTDSPDGSPSRMRTRNKNTPPANEAGSRGRPKRSGTSTPDSEVDKKAGCKSPGASSSNSGSGSPSDKAKKKKLETPTKGKKRPPLDLDVDEEKDANIFKRKKNDRPESPSESLTTDSGSVADDADNNDNDADAAEAPTDIKIDPDRIKLDDVKPILDLKSDLSLSHKDEDVKVSPLLVARKEEVGLPPVLNVGITVLPVSTTTDVILPKEDTPAIVDLEPGISESQPHFGSSSQNSVPGPLPGPALPVSISGQMPGSIAQGIIPSSMMGLSLGPQGAQLCGQPTQQTTQQSQPSGQPSQQPGQTQQGQQTTQQSGQTSQQSGQQSGAPGPPGPPPPGSQGPQAPASQAAPPASPVQANQQPPSSPGQAESGKSGNGGSPNGPTSISQPATPGQPSVLPEVGKSNQTAPAPTSPIPQEGSPDGPSLPSDVPVPVLRHPLQDGEKPEEKPPHPLLQGHPGLSLPAVPGRPPHPSLIPGISSGLPPGLSAPPGYPYLSPHQQAQYQQYLQQQWGSAPPGLIPPPGLQPPPVTMPSSAAPPGAPVTPTGPTTPGSAPSAAPSTPSSAPSSLPGTPSTALGPGSLPHGSLPPGALPPGALPPGVLGGMIPGAPPGLLPGNLSLGGTQSEPQNLKIKQELPTPTEPLALGPMTDPLQSLKDVKVPGYSGPPLANLDSIKSEQPDPPSQAAPPSKTPPNKPRSVTPTDAFGPVHTPPSVPRAPSTHTPPVHIPTSAANPPTSIPQPVMHPSQQPSPLNRISPGHHLAHPHAFVAPMHHPHHPLMAHHPLLTAAALHGAGVPHPYAHPHAHAYSGYPYPFPYPYAIPQPVPPPSRMHESPKPPTPRDGFGSEGTTTLTSHSSSVMTRRESAAPDEATQETTTTHHSSSHATHHTPGAHKQLTISHSASSSVQHKTTKQRSSSPGGAPTSSSHVSATLSQTTSASISTSGHSSHHHQHQHSHQHHHSSPSPGTKIHHPLPSHPGHPSSHQPHSGHPGHASHQPHPSHGVHSSHPAHPLSLPPMPGSSLEALRAHAQAAANLQQQQHGTPHRHDDVKQEDGDHAEEEEVPSPTHIPRGPSPEPKIEDTECHRSQSAIFLRHWNRGDFNSCTRTDLTFKPVPESKLARKREDKLRKQAEKEREEREKAEARKNATPEKQDGKPPSRGAIETVTPPYDRFGPRQGYPDTPALRQLSEYARPHASFSPTALQRSAAMGLPPHCMDTMMQYHQLSLYGPGARERLEMEEMERQKREREMRELQERELNDRLKEQLMKNAAAAGPRGPLDPHWLDLHRRYALGVGGPPQGPASLHQFGLYQPQGPGLPGSLSSSLNQLERERLERIGIPGPPVSSGPGPSPHPHHPGHPIAVPVHPAHQAAAAAQLEAAERLALATDPIVRLQMAGISPEYHAHTHAHTHAHSHTHLHLHPGQQAQQAQAQQEAAAAAAGYPLSAAASAAYPRPPSLLPPREAAMAMHHPSELLGRPYADQLVHQVSMVAAHEQLQRQIMLERERFSHPSFVAHEEYLRQQRERELKVRALEEAARGSRS